jgi:N-acyl-D-amino-acid deacylase
MHTHSDLSFMLDSTAQSKVRQGVTTEVTGNCGISTCAPLIGAAAEFLKSELDGYGTRLDVDWTTYGEWLDRLAKTPATLNLATLVGHNTVRAAVMGFDDRGPTPDEMETMKRFVAESLEAGAMGFSTGLYYAPGSYARTEEVMVLAREAGRRGKLYASHIRDESDFTVGLFCAVYEAIEIGRQSGARVEVAHTKCAGPSVWGMAGKLMETFEQARREGIDFGGDQYPYNRSSTTLSATLFPRWAQVGGREGTLKVLTDTALRSRLLKYMEDVLPTRGGADGIVIASFPPDRGLEGKSIRQIAADWEESISDAALRLFQQFDPFCVLSTMQESDVEVIAAAPWICVGSDGSSISPTGPLSKGKPHPRFYGTHPRFLARYVREKKAVSLEEGIRKMTSLPASRLGLTRRGRLLPGYYADVAVFDPATVEDKATFENPHLFPAGIPHVIVNGVNVIKDGKFTGKTPGRVIRDFGG